MNLNLAKNKVMNELGITHHFLFKGIRNQIEEFDGIIIKCFPAIFVIDIQIPYLNCRI